MDPETLHQLTLWTGRFAALFLVLNFTTCFVMPWARNKLPWRGAHPGKDNRDKYGRFQFTFVHRWFAWSSIIVVAIHVVFSIISQD